MKKILALALILIVLPAGCSRTWKAGGLGQYQQSGSAALPTACEPCHEREYGSWKKSRHAQSSVMSGLTHEELRACGACHSNTAAHAEDPESGTPSNPSRLSKAEQNAVCGKCHYSQEVLGRRAINPRDRHAMFMSVGFEGHHRQISCLECHQGHGGRSNMLAGARAHVCFRCHKTAIVTMGIFQPVNYLTFGRACQACHTVHGGSAAAKVARMSVGVCVVCHFGGTAITGGEGE